METESAEGKEVVNIIARRVKTESNSSEVYD